MTADVAFCCVVFRGLLPTSAVTPSLVARWPWFDARCEVVLVATEALAELGRPRTRLELGKCLLADGWSFPATCSILAEVVPATLDPSALELARLWLLEQCAEVAA